MLEAAHSCFALTFELAEVDYRPAIKELKHLVSTMNGKAFGRPMVSRAEEMA